MISLTAKQAELLAFIKSYMAENKGLAPSTEEMREACGLASKSGVNRLLNGLEERRVIRRMHFRARAIQVLTPASTARSTTDIADLVCTLAFAAKANGEVITVKTLRRIVLEALG
ncbi:LexA family protein [Phenylobacterium sp.]|uniref:LexA family protein n=1 Tax=Phenylobacterium sp. TaxID=1871053 RepID=UPI0030034128